MECEEAIHGPRVLHSDSKSESDARPPSGRDCADNHERPRLPCAITASTGIPTTTGFVKVVWGDDLHEHSERDTK